MALLVLLAACAPLPAYVPPADAAAPTPALRPGSVEGACVSTWIAPQGETVGALRFEGGFRLQGVRGDFGGLSGLEAIDDDHLIALTDQGGLVAIAVSEDADGTPIARCTLTPLRDERGRRFRTKELADSEGLALLAPDRIAASFERDHRVAVFGLGGEARQIGPEIDFSGAQRLEDNQGIEALGLLPSGALIAGAETAGLLGRPHPVWRLAPGGGSGPAFEEPGDPAFEIAGDAGYGLVGFDATPRGGLLALERFYAEGIGNRIKIGWLPGAVAETGSGVVEPVPLGRLTRGDALDVDNFEGVAALAAEDGRTTVFIVSDDNFSDDQKTLLYRFSFDEAAVERSAMSD